MLGLLRAQVAISEDRLGVFQILGDQPLIVGSAVHADRALQHIDRHAGAFFDPLGPLLAHYSASEVGVEQVVKIVIIEGITQASSKIFFKSMNWCLNY